MGKWSYFTPYQWSYNISSLITPRMGVLIFHPTFSHWKNRPSLIVGDPPITLGFFGRPNICGISFRAPGGLPTLRSRIAARPPKMLIWTWKTVQRFRGENLQPVVRFVSSEGFSKPTKTFQTRKRNTGSRWSGLFVFCLRTKCSFSNVVVASLWWKSFM